jgi:hypothetical protein
MTSSCLCVERPSDLHTGLLMANSSKPVQFSLAKRGSARKGAEKFARAHDCTLSEVRGDRASLKSGGIVLITGVASCVADQRRSGDIEEAVQLQRLPFASSHSRRPDEEPAQQSAGVCGVVKSALRRSVLPVDVVGRAEKAMAGSGRRKRKVLHDHMKWRLTALSSRIGDGLYEWRSLLEQRVGEVQDYITS